MLLNEIKNNDLAVKDELIYRNDTAQNIYQNFYLSNLFNQKETMKYLKSISGNDTVILFNQFDQPSIQLYLNLFDVKFREVNSQEELGQLILNNEKTLLVTSLESRTLLVLDRIKTVTSTVVMDKYPVTTIVKVTKKH